MKRKTWIQITVFAFVATAATVAFAQEGAKAVLGDEVKKALAIASGFGIALATIGGAIGQGIAISAAVTGISRNPGASGKIFVPMIVGLALIESLVLYTWIVSLALNGKI
ncbi:MAG: ATP synthase F0 subunit C [Pseudomonadota bacterium]